MLMKQIIDAYEVLDSSFVTGDYEFMAHKKRK